MSEMNAQPALRLGPETETDRGWRYTLAIGWSVGEPTEHAVTMSHQDYEHWCGGVEPPSRVAERAVRIAAAALGRDLPPRFDLSQLRRRVEDFDARMTDAL